MSLDLTVAEHANAWAAHHDGWEDVARAYASVSELLFVAGVVLLALAGLVLRRRPLLAASALAVLAAGAGVVVATVAGKLIGRPRPFAAHPHQIHAFLAHAPDPGFPSDHATAAFAIGTVLLLVLGARTLPVLLAAVALAISRVLVGIHYPGDVIAGALLGAAAGVVVVLLARRLIPAVTEATPRAPRREKLGAVPSA
jgi:undecaprenyl-diphosphatase